MLLSKNDTSISAGVQVQKQQKIRLTAAIRCWDEQLESDVELGHEDYTVKQGDGVDGTVARKIMERIGSSDITDSIRNQHAIRPAQRVYNPVGSCYDAIREYLSPGGRRGREAGLALV